jgi:hypothetical protein
MRTDQSPQCPYLESRLLTSNAFALSMPTHSKTVNEAASGEPTCFALQKW